MLHALGPYEILSELGQGGMGVVYHARHVPLNRLVALKLLPLHTLEDGSLARFQREMRLCASLSHPNLVKILDGGVLDNTPFLAMELLSGQSLEKVLAADALTWTRTCSIVRDMGRALTFLHEHQIVHRDIKPSNVFLLPDGSVKLIDFGLARRRDSTLVTAAGELVGTLPYLSPELVVGSSADARSDLWATGCLLFQMLTQKLPFSSTNYYQLLTEIQSAPIPDPRAQDRSIPERVATLVRELLIRDPERRLGPATHLVERLEEILDSPVASRPRPGGISTSSREPETVDAFDPNATMPLTRRPPPLPPVSPRPAVVVRAESPGRSHVWLVQKRHAAVLVGLVVLALGWSMRRPATPPVPPPPLATPSATPLPSAAPPGLFDGWKKVEPLLHLLKQERMDASTHATFVRAAGVDLGAHSAHWSHWVRLGHWLAAPDRPARPPRSSRSHTGPLGWGSVDTAASAEEVAYHHLWRGQMASNPQEVLRFGLDAVTQWPDDPRGWLAMGRLLDLCSDQKRSVPFYDLALRMSVADRLGGWRAPAWEAFARALFLVPGRDLETEWLKTMSIHPPEPEAFDGLVSALGDSDRLEHLLMKCSQLPHQRDMALGALGRLFRTRVLRLAAEGKYERAARVSQVLLNTFPDSPAAVEAKKMAATCLVAWHLNSGNLKAARSLIERGSCPSEMTLVMDYCLKGAAMEVSPIVRDRILHLDGIFGSHLRSLEAMRLQERGEHAAALLWLRQWWVKHPQFEFHKTERTLDLLAALGPSPELEGYARPSLFESREALLVSNLWRYAAQALSTPQGQPVMEALLARTAKARPAVLQQMVEFKSLWLCYSRRFAESMKELPANSMWTYEVMVRPLWEDILQLQPDPNIFAKAKAVSLTVEVNGTAALAKRNYFRLTRNRELEATSVVLACLRTDSVLDPGQVLMDAWTASVTNTPGEFQKTLYRLRAGARFRGLGFWLLLELDRLEKAFKSRHETRPPAPGKDFPQNGTSMR